jgi:hypothetical protein
MNKKIQTIDNPGAFSKAPNLTLVNLTNVCRSNDACNSRLTIKSFYNPASKINTDIQNDPTKNTICPKKYFLKWNVELTNITIKGYLLRLQDDTKWKI